jgi:hypothetical protein
MELLKNPVIVLQIAGLAFTGLTFVVGWAVVQWNAKNKQQIEMTYVNSILVGVENIVTRALADGKTDIGEIVTLTLSYLYTNKPDAMKAMEPKYDAIKTITVEAIVNKFPGADIVGDMVKLPFNKTL